MINTDLGYTANDLSQEETGPVLLFTGQGAQYPRMGRDLYNWNAFFRSTVNECAEILDDRLPLPLLDILFASKKSGNRINQTQFAQPALFVIEYALAKLWISAGVKPLALLGHSIGEIVAACIGGVFDLQKALDLVTHRSTLMQKLPPGGGMVSVLASCTEVQKILSDNGIELDIAAVNTRESVVISGEQSQIEKLCVALEVDQLPYQRLNVSHAFHSSRMEPMLESFGEKIRSLSVELPETPIFSNITGDLLLQERMDASYWIRQVRGTVRFADCLSSVDSFGAQSFLEVGPAPILLGLGKRHLGRRSKKWIASLRPGTSDVIAILDAAVQLYKIGQPIDWTIFSYS